MAQTRSSVKVWLLGKQWRRSATSDLPSADQKLTLKDAASSRNGEFLQGGLLRVTTKRRLRGIHQTLHNFPGWCRSCINFFTNTQSVPPGMMDNQSHLQSEDVLVPASVHFDYQTETQCKGASTL